MRRFRSALPLFALALATLALAAVDVDELGFDRTQLEESMFGALRGSYGAPDVPTELREWPDAEKVAAVRTLGAFAKEFFASPDMKKRYDEARKSSRPKRSPGVPKLSLDPRAVARKGLEKQALAKAGGKPLPAGELDRDPRVQLKRRLQAFLAVTEDVDYDAKTTVANRRGQFVDEVYEAKPNEWKLCYRAGRATGDAIRAFAKQWLAELP
jgi:hypothetical protein